MMKIIFRLIIKVELFAGVVAISAFAAQSILPDAIKHFIIPLFLLDVAFGVLLGLWEFVKYRCRKRSEKRKQAHALKDFLRDTELELRREGLK